MRYEYRREQVEVQQSKKILIIEDDDAIREMMASILEIEGHRTVMAKNGKEGIEALQSEVPPDVVLLDMMMPVMNGWQVLDFLRTNATTRQIPVVIVSAYGETARAARPKAFVPKPVQLKTLLDAIERSCA